MVSARDFRELALVPIRGTVYVFSLPFVLTSKFLSLLYLLFVSTPLSWAKRLAMRIEVTWEWTKCSAKSMLPWNYYSSSRYNSAIASRSLEHAVEAGHGGEDYLSNAEALLEQRRPSSRSARRQRRKALISHLIRALLEPASPSDSDDELERLNSEDRLYQLVRELINISKQETGPLKKTRNLPVLDLEALKANARDKEKLLAFITELDEYVAGMESGSPHEGESSGACANTSETFCDAGGRRAEEEELSHDLFSSPDPASEDGIEVDSNEEEEKYADARLELPYPHPANSRRGLSPLIEVSSELASAESTESVRNCADLETELNAALSRLSDMTSELEGAVEDEAVLVGARQVRVTETVTLEPDQQLESNKTCQPEMSDSLFEDARDEFPSIPKIEPTLGIKDGHNKRDVASVRRSRPPSAHRVKNLQEPMDTSQGGGDCDSEYTSDEEQREEGLPHSLSDQLMLLSPSSLQSHTLTATSAENHKPEQDPSSSAVPLYASVNKEARLSARANSDGQQSTGGSNDVQSPSLSKPGEPIPKESEPIRKAPEMSLFIHDRIPPWKQMRSRSNSNTEQANSQPSTPTQPPAPVHPLSAQSHTATSTASREVTPPPIPPYTPSSHPLVTQSQSRIKNLQESSSSEEGKEGPDMYDKLPGMQMMPPIPSHAGQEGVYDTIPFHQQQQQLQAQRPQYLHERIAKKNESKSRPPVSHTPDLPPRNSRMRRTASADVMDQLAGDQDYSRLRRSGSERRSMSAADDDHRDPMILSSSKRRHSLSGERDRRAVSGGSHHQHQDHSGISRHRSSSEKHHPSSASTKHPSSASEKPVEIGMANFLKILVSPSSSKSKSSASKDATKVKSSASKDAAKAKSNASKDVAKVKLSASKDVARKKDVSKTKKEEGRHSRDEGKKHRHSFKSQSKDEDDDSIGIPRNESKTSLRSGVSMHSFESSSSIQDYFD